MLESSSTYVQIIKQRCICTRARSLLERVISMIEKYRDQQFGNYRLIRLLGQGGFADVYLGKHIHISREAALKFLNMRLRGNDIKQFRDEADIIAHLKHPHIVSLLDFGVENDTPFLVMEY